MVTQECCRYLVTS